MGLAAAAAAVALAAGAATARECVFYLEPAGSAGFSARLYDPEKDRDAPAPAKLVPSPDLAWDWRYARLYWLDGLQLRRVAWKARPPWERPIALPPELREPAAWWLDRERLQVARRTDTAVEVWEHDRERREWKLLERARTLAEGAPPERQAAAALFTLASRRRDHALESRLEALRAGRHLGRIRWAGGAESGSAFWPLLGTKDCGLRFQVDRDAEGAHAAAPLVHWCKGQDQGRVVFDAPEGGSFARTGFDESGAWLLAGREARMDQARVLASKDGSLRKALSPDASHAVWVPCPK